jgi:NADH:ubiquinone oxidoreductase subunit 6 (subunit J)
MAIIAGMIIIMETNSFHFVLFLILLFFNSFILLMLLGIEFFGLSILIIYVGAISILFIFLIMTIKEIEVPKEHKIYSFYFTKGLKIKGLKYSMNFLDFELEFIFLFLLFCGLFIF